MDLLGLLCAIVGGDTLDWKRAIECLGEIKDSKVENEFIEECRERLMYGEGGVDPVAVVFTVVARIVRTKLGIEVYVYGNYLDTHFTDYDEEIVLEKVIEKAVEDRSVLHEPAVKFFLEEIGIDPDRVESAVNEAEIIGEKIEEVFGEGILDNEDTAEIAKLIYYGEWEEVEEYIADITGNSQKVQEIFEHL